jgi:hypothetical protein
MGFPDSFVLDDDDLAAYQLLGNAVAPPTALAWLHMALACIGSSSDAFSLQFAALLFRAVPVNFISPCSMLPLLNPGSVCFDSADWLAQSFAVTPALFHLVVSSGATMSERDRICGGLGREKLSRIEDIAVFSDAKSLLSRILQGRSCTPRFAKLVHLIWEDASLENPGLTLDLERIICEQLHEGAAVTLKCSILQHFPDLDTLQGDLFWSSIGNCRSEENTWRWAAELGKLARAAAHLHFTSPLSTRAFALSTATQARSGSNAWVLLPSSLHLERSGLAAEADASRFFLEALQAAAIANIFLLAAAPPGVQPQPNYRLLASAFVAKCRGAQNPIARLLF